MSRRERLIYPKAFKQQPAELIKDIYAINDNFPIRDEKYDPWLKKLLNKTYEDITINDTYTMLSQRQLEELGIRKAIQFILEDPLAGEMWEGQFLEQLSFISLDKLAPYKSGLNLIPEYVMNNINDSMWDFDDDKKEYLERLRIFSETIAKL